MIIFVAVRFPLQLTIQTISLLKLMNFVSCGNENFKSLPIDLTLAYIVDGDLSVACHLPKYSTLFAHINFILVLFTSHFVVTASNN